jgi:hypothetical protein
MARDAACNMLTGHNTEIQHEELAFHVQTEDKGRANPVIVSLIYVGGRVLAAKRTSYAGLLAQGLAEREIAELMDRQHRTMLAAIRRGRFDEHVRKLYEPRAMGTAVGHAAAPDGDHALEDLGQSLDEMVSEFLGAEPPESLTLVIEPGPTPRAGEEAEIAIQALAMPGSRRIGGAEVRVEVISPFEPPRILASGRTDEGGRWSQRLLVPASIGGLAALIVAVRCPLGDAEQKILL